MWTPTGRAYESSNAKNERVGEWKLSLLLPDQEVACTLQWLDDARLQERPFAQSAEATAYGVFDPETPQDLKALMSKYQEDLKRDPFAGEAAHGVSYPPYVAEQAIDVHVSSQTTRQAVKVARLRKMLADEESVLARNLADDMQRVPRLNDFVVDELGDVTPDVNQSGDR
jgi:hypothetical protein